jgi:hypothetical protein
VSSTRAGFEQECAAKTKKNIKNFKLGAKKKVQPGKRLPPEKKSWEAKKHKKPERLRALKWVFFDSEQRKEHFVAVIDFAIKKIKKSRKVNFYKLAAKNFVRVSNNNKLLFLAFYFASCLRLK